MLSTPICTHCYSYRPRGTNQRSPYRRSLLLELIGLGNPNMGNISYLSFLRVLRLVLFAMQPLPPRMSPAAITR